MNEFFGIITSEVDPELYVSNLDPAKTKEHIDQFISAERRLVYLQICSPVTLLVFAETYIRKSLKVLLGKKTEQLYILIWQFH